MEKRGPKVNTEKTKMLILGKKPTVPLKLDGTSVGAV